MFSIKTSHTTSFEVIDAILFTRETPIAAPTAPRQLKVNTSLFKLYSRKARTATIVSASR